MPVSHAYRSLWVLVIGLLGAVMSGCANEAVLTPLNWSEAHRQIMATTDLAYGTDVRQKLDVYRPQMAQRAPVMVFWYGGSWQHGEGLLSVRRNSARTAWLPRNPARLSPRA
jgi:hypothetical protein